MHDSDAPAFRFYFFVASSGLIDGEPIRHRSIRIGNSKGPEQWLGIPPDLHDLHSSEFACVVEWFTQPQFIARAVPPCKATANSSCLFKFHIYLSSFPFFTPLSFCAAHLAKHRRLRAKLHHVCPAGSLATLRRGLRHARHKRSRLCRQRPRQRANHAAQSLVQFLEFLRTAEQQASFGNAPRTNLSRLAHEL